MKTPFFEMLCYSFNNFKYSRDREELRDTEERYTVGMTFVLNQTFF